MGNNNGSNRVAPAEFVAPTGGNTVIAQNEQQLRMLLNQYHVDDARQQQDFNNVLNNYVDYQKLYNIVSLPSSRVFSELGTNRSSGGDGGRSGRSGKNSGRRRKGDRSARKEEEIEVVVDPRQAYHDLMQRHQKEEQTLQDTIVSDFRGIQLQCIDALPRLLEGGVMVFKTAYNSDWNELYIAPENVLVRVDETEEGSSRTGALPNVVPIPDSDHVRPPSVMDGEQVDLYLNLARAKEIFNESYYPPALIPFACELIVENLERLVATVNQERSIDGLVTAEHTFGQSEAIFQSGLIPYLETLSLFFSSQDAQTRKTAHTLPPSIFFQDHFGGVFQRVLGSMGKGFSELFAIKLMGLMLRQWSTQFIPLMELSSIIRYAYEPSESRSTDGRLSLRQESTMVDFKRKGAKQIVGIMPKDYQNFAFIMEWTINQAKKGNTQGVPMRWTQVHQFLMDLSSSTS